MNLCGSMLYLSTNVLGVPTIMRSDCGTENSSLAACHMALRHQHDDEFSGLRSFRYGSSTTNTVIINSHDPLSVFSVQNLQRIESWWGQLRKSVTDYWMNLFKVGTYSS